jgi:hypothetical protein
VAQIAQLASNTTSSILCKKIIYLFAAVTRCVRTSEPGLPRLPAFGCSPAKLPSAWVLKDLQDGIWIYSVNFENKYNRTLGKAFVDGHFYAFAVNSKNFGQVSQFPFNNRSSL